MQSVRQLIFDKIFKEIYPIYDINDKFVRVSFKYEIPELNENLKMFGWIDDKNKKIWNIPKAFDFELDNWLLAFYGINKHEIKITNGN